MKKWGTTLRTAKFGFSLVEVTLSIGIISFALLAVVALLPVGLKSLKNSAEQAAGAEVLQGLSEALRHAATDDGTNYAVVFNNTTNTFTADGGASEVWSWNNLSLEGVNDFSNRRVVARLKILKAPSADRLHAGRAVASVAWSAMGNPTFDSDTHSWTGAEGTLTVPLQFLPGRP